MKQTQLIVVGSIGIDTIETHQARRPDILGGSASYACAAASFFTKTGMVGIVGTDFPADYRALYEKFDIDLQGLQTVEGKTFRWSGKYRENMDERATLSTDLNVFADFMPDLPESYKTTPFVFLANIAPALQIHVLDQVVDPKFVVADTMDLWIDNTPEDLRKLIARVHMLTLNESEAKHLTGHKNLLLAARAIMNMGPAIVLIKKGENGSIFFSGNEIYLRPAYPLESVVDPTGAGDSFAGGFMGRLAGCGEASTEAIKDALFYGSVVASFGVEAFSLERLSTLTQENIEHRVRLLKTMVG